MSGRARGYAERMPASAEQHATIVVAEAPDELQAAIWVDALRDAGVQAAMFERGVGAALGGSVTSWSRYPVIVSEEHLLAARNIIAELGGASSLAPYRDPAALRARQTRQSRLLAAGLLGIAAVVAIGVVARIVG